MNVYNLLQCVCHCHKANSARIQSQSTGIDSFSLDINKYQEQHTQCFSIPLKIEHKEKKNDVCIELNRIYCMRSVFPVFPFCHRITSHHIYSFVILC